MKKNLFIGLLLSLLLAFEAYTAFGDILITNQGASGGGQVYVAAGKTLTVNTSLTNAGGPGQLTWPTGGTLTTLTIPTGGGTLGTAAFTAAAAYAPADLTTYSGAGIFTAVDVSGSNITAGAGTGITVNSAGYVNRQVYKVTTTYAAYADTDGTKGIVIATLPAKTKLTGCYADTTAAYKGGAVSATTLKVGITSEGGAEIVASHDVWTGAVMKGLADADMGTSMTRAAQIQGGYLPSWTATTAIYATIDTTNANTNALTAGSTTFYLITERY